MLKVVTFGNDILSRKSDEIKNVDDEVKELVKDMFQTMYFSNGIGLAAVQVGILKRIVTIDVPKFGKFTLINPVIKKKSINTAVFEEGCLSLPGIANEVERSAEITVEYLDLDGNKKTLDAKGLLSTCIQHEVDHLDGILFIDRIDPEDRLSKIKEYRKLHIV